MPFEDVGKENNGKPIGVSKERAALAPEEHSMRLAAFEIARHPRAIKALSLCISGYAPDEEELSRIDVASFLMRLRATAPTLESAEHDLSHAVAERVGVVRSDNMSEEELQEAKRVKQRQYMEEGVRPILDALGPIYEMYGVVPSEENKSRVLEELTEAALAERGENASDDSAYVRALILAATSQTYTAEEARVITQIARSYFGESPILPNGESDNAITNAVRRVRDVSGLALIEAREELARSESVLNESIPVTDCVPDLRAFVVYIEEHWPHIVSERRAGRDVSRVFFDEFLQSDMYRWRYRADGEETEDAIRTYNRGVADSNRRLLLDATTHPRELRVHDDRDWNRLYAHVHGGLREDSASGSFYFNTTPESTGQFFSSIVGVLRMRGIPAQMELSMRADPSVINSTDKIALRMNTRDEASVLAVVEECYRAFPGGFDDSGIPRFTSPVVDVEGRAMQGVGFGEEPSSLDASFGVVRSEMLGQVFRDGVHEGKSLSSPAFDLSASYRRACEKYQIDPASPAFNASNGVERTFPLMRERTTLPLEQ